MDRNESIQFTLNNCMKCKKGFRLGQFKTDYCELETEVTVAFFGDGMIPFEIMERIGYDGNCKECDRGELA
jgi:hypothetical protein